MNVRTSRSNLLIGPVEHDQRFERIAESLFNVDLAAIRAGKSDAIHTYVIAWLEARHDLLSFVRSDQPTLIEPPLLADAIEQEALQAPFSVWVAKYGNRGLALDMLARIRTLVAPQSEPLPAPTTPGHYRFDAGSVQLFRYQVLAELAQDGTAAAKIRRAFDINLTELGRLFGVSRQAVAQWPEGEIPAGKRGKAGVILATADLLEHRLKSGRLPLVARKPAAAYGGLTMVEMIEQDRHEELLDSVRNSFDYSATA